MPAPPRFRQAAPSQRKGSPPSPRRFPQEVPLFCRKCVFRNGNDGQPINLGRNMQLRTAAMQLFQHCAALFFFVFYLYGQILFCHWNFPFFRPPFACPLSQFFRVFYLSTLSTLSILCPPFFILYPLYSPCNRLSISA